MNSKAMAIVGILSALAAGCDSDPTTGTTRDSAVDLSTSAGGSSGMGGVIGTGGATAGDDGGPTLTATGGKGGGGSLGTGLGGAGMGGGSLATGGGGGRTGTGGANSATGGGPGVGGAGSGGHPMDGGLDASSPAIDGARDVPADQPFVAYDGAPDAPACINQLISDAQAAPVGYPPMSYYQCSYKGQNVYYTPPQCCDQFSQLYAADCTVICAPDGGFTGRGDGRCPDFDQDTCTVIWQDRRTH